MDATQFELIEEIFFAALEIPAADRSTFVCEKSQGNELIEQEILALLAASELDDTLIHFPASQLWENFAEGESTPRLPEIDRYRVIREIGEGGMATVYLAEQLGDEFTRQVAVKVLRGNAATKRFLRRFLRERQILAGLSHPNIATLYGGGISKTGDPFIAMEFIDGLTVTDYCSTKRLDLQTRLRIFLEICRAVAYAHHRLVIHRDLKPSNILVTEDGTPKLLDFGIAKVITGEQQGFPTETQPGERFLTPAYASPEQVTGETVTTATDIYALGLMLHQLATGRLPYELKLGTISEALREICETEVRLPSILPVERSVLEGFGMGMTPKRLRSELRGDLDTIVCKALQKDPARRYASVEQFAEDISRSLQGLPILARADSFWYRTAKFVRRNRVQVAAAGLVSASLFGGSGIAIWQSSRAQRERELATVIQARYKQQSKDTQAFIKAQFEIYDDLKDKAGSTETRAKIVKNIASFLESSEEDAVNDPSLALVLAEGYSRLGEVQGKPKQGQIGDISGALISYDRARRLYLIALPKADDPAEIRAKLAGIHEALGLIKARKGNCRDAESEYLQGLKYCASNGMGRETFREISLRKRLADLFYLTGKLAYSLDFNRRVATAAISLDPTDIKNQELIASTRMRIVFPLKTMWEAMDARIGETTFTKAIKQSAVKFQRDHIDLCVALHNRKPDSIVFHSYVLNAECRLGYYLYLAGEKDEARRVSLESLEKIEQLLKDESTNQEYQNLLTTAETLAGEIIAGTGDLKQGLALLAKAERRMEGTSEFNRNNGEFQVDAAKLEFLIGGILGKSGNVSEEIHHYGKGMDLLEAISSDNIALDVNANIAGIYTLLARRTVETRFDSRLSDCLRRLVRLQKNHAGQAEAPPIQIHNLTWMLLTCPLPDIRNPVVAREFMNRAASRGPGTEPYAILFDLYVPAKEGKTAEVQKLTGDLLNLFPEIKMENREAAAIEFGRKFSTL